MFAVSTTCADVLRGSVHPILLSSTPMLRSRSASPASTPPARIQEHVDRPQQIQRVVAQVTVVGSGTVEELQLPVGCLSASPATQPAEHLSRNSRSLSSTEPSGPPNVEQPGRAFRTAASPIPLQLDLRPARRPTAASFRERTAAKYSNNRTGPVESTFIQRRLGERQRASERLVRKVRDEAKSSGASDPGSIPSPSALSSNASEWSARCPQNAVEMPETTSITESIPASQECISGSRSGTRWPS